MSLSERLAGPFNVETTIEPISIKISDAIMNFQESGFQVVQIRRYVTGSNFPLLFMFILGAEEESLLGMYNECTIWCMKTRLH